ncbi:MAG: hypothetical protein PHS44_03270 [Candidatus Dojkabacteria bacterium]|nr:hypothetical protein [Candidatus Dojkabacteria bacterium]
MNKVSLTPQLHTSEHILGQILDKMCNGFKTTSLEIRDDDVRYDFKVDTMPENVTKELLEAKVNAIISKNIPVEISEFSRQEAEEIGIDLSIVPRSVEVIRIVDIKGVNKQACAGEHVKNTSDISKFEIVKFVKKGSNSYQIVSKINSM